MPSNRIRVGSDAQVLFQGAPNRVVEWSLIGAGTLTPITGRTDASGRAYARYTPADEGEARIRVEYGSGELPAPSILLSISPAEAVRGVVPATITWSSQNIVGGELTATVYCESLTSAFSTDKMSYTTDFQGGSYTRFDGPQPTSGTLIDIYPLLMECHYDITLSGAGWGGVPADATASFVYRAPVPLTVDLTGPEVAFIGQPFEIQWTITGTDESLNPIAIAGGNWDGDKSLPSGSEEIIPSEAGSMSFALYVGSDNQATVYDTLSVEVVPAPFWGPGEMGLSAMVVDQLFSAVAGVGIDNQPVDGCGPFDPDPLVTNNEGINSSAHAVSEVTSWDAGAQFYSDSPVVANHFFTHYRLHGLPPGRGVTVTLTGDGGAMAVSNQPGPDVMLPDTPVTGAVNEGGAFDVQIVALTATLLGQGKDATLGSVLRITVLIHGA